MVGAHILLRLVDVYCVDDIYRKKRFVPRGPSRLLTSNRSHTLDGKRQAIICTRSSVGTGVAGEGERAAAHLASGKYALPCLPSVIALEDSNVVINSVHADAKSITVKVERQLLYDPRMLRL